MKHAVSRFAARAWRASMSALAMAGLLALASLGRADDETFRDLDLQQALSPQQLAELIANLRNTPVPQGQGPGGQQETPGSEPSPESSQTLEKVLKELEPLLKDTRIKAPKTSDGQRIDQTDIAPERGNAEPQPGSSENNPGSRNPSREPSSLPAQRNRPANASNRNPSIPPDSANRNRSQDGENTGTPTESSDPQAETTGREGSPGRQSTPPAFPRWPNVPRSPEPQPQGGGSNQPTAERLEPPIPPGTSHPPATASRNTPGGPRLTVKSRQQFNEAMNRILVEAARHAKEKEAGEESAVVTASRESILNPIISRVEKLVADEGHNRSNRPSWMRGRGGRSWSLGRFKWRFPTPGAPSPDALAPGGSLWVLLSPVLLCLLILATIPLWRRLQPKLSKYLNVSAALTHFALLRIDSRDDLVRAVDRFLLLRFGLVSTWWHCRTVERALAGLRPELRSEVASLMATYEISRYGPNPEAVTHEQVQEAAEVLRRLAESPETAAAPLPSPAA